MRTLVHAEPRKRGGLKAIDDATQAFPERRSAKVDQQTNLSVGELEIGRLRASRPAHGT